MNMQLCETKSFDIVGKEHLAWMQITEYKWGGNQRATGFNLLRDGETSLVTLMSESLRILLSPIHFLYVTSNIPISNFKDANIFKEIK